MRAIDLKRIRTKVLKMTQRELADAIGLSRRQIGRYESAIVPVSDKSARMIGKMVGLHTEETEQRKRRKW